MKRTRTLRDDRGAASAFVVGMAITLLVCAGLVVDGGGALNARMKLADDVEQAARAGAQEIDLIELHESGVTVIDSGAAQARATDYLLDRGYHGIVVTADGDTVTARAEDTVPTNLLLLIGIEKFDVSASATAEAVVP